MKWKRYCRHPYPIVLQLRQVRESRGIPRKVIEYKIGYHKMTIGRWERGDTQPSLQALHDWCQVLGVEIGINEPEAT
jgi:transcriptional regulator with XRE-family HTH domain